MYAFADRMYSEGKRPDPDLVLDEHALSRSRWLTREELEKRFLEKVKEHQYQEVIKVMLREKINCTVGSVSNFYVFP